MTEQEVSTSWTRLFRKPPITGETFERAAELIEQLRDESPLRTRLQGELEELRELHAEKV